MSSSSHHPSPFSHLNNNNIGGGGSGGGSTQNSVAPPHHNNLQQQQLHHPDYDEFEDVDNEQTQQQQELLFDEAPIAEDENMDDSGEDTEEASETELGSSSNHRNIDEPIEIKEQMYQDKLASLKKQLEELRAGTHPEYVRRVKKLEHQYNERIRLNEIYREYLISCVERDYILEKNAAVKEYEEKKNDLQENLVTDFEDRRKMIESERATMELTGDSIDVKPTVTRKLRRRPNEPLPVPEKRRKPTTGQLVLLLDEKEVENDLKLISRGKAVHAIRTHTNSTSNAGNGSSSLTTNSTALAGMVSPVANSYQMNNSSSSAAAAATTTTTGAASSSATNEISIAALPPSTLNALHSNPPLPATNSALVAPPAHVGQNLNQNNHPSQPQQQQQQAPPPSGSQQPPNNPQPPATAQPPPPVQQQPQPQPQPQQQPPPPPAPPAPPAPLVETRIEDGKLLYERRWFHRGQPVYVEGKDIPRFSANISAIGSEAIWVKKTSDGQKVRIFTNQLSRGKVSIKRRAN